ncbi:amidase signature enzyme [Crepidotus variabilis]|uniref:Amidase signature enzyme n=1 Tax=Crepidotus variabilis TaxID=179855 RepID=A0A9P6EA07_9AGAR|nr:amidase signature enzyme [Crepidotus variabilis]
MRLSMLVFPALLATLHAIQSLDSVFASSQLVNNLKGLSVSTNAEVNAKFPDLYEASVLELQEGLDKGTFSSVDLVKTYIARIKEVNTQGPALRAVIEISPTVLDVALALDKERKTGGKRSMLHGIPILLKDNIATLASEGMNTTAGSYSLLGSVVPDDAGVVKRLRKAGAIILGKSNLSEFAYFRDWSFPSGWSGRGGQCFNAYYNNTDPCGSSSGSGVAASIGLSALTLGTETDGSITCPSSNNNIVGIKPTVGLTSRAGVVPISEHQDTVGPMTRSVADAAFVLSAIAGKDTNDNYTLAQPSTVPDYSKALRADAFKGKHIGVPRVNSTNPPSANDIVMNEALENAIQIVRELGATVIDPVELPSANEILNVGNAELFILETDFKIQLGEYYKSLAKNPSGVRSLADLIVYNDAHPELEEYQGHEGQSILRESQSTTGRNSTYFKTLSSNKDVGGKRGIDAALTANRLDALMAPALGWLTTPAAIAGYPIITLPLGFYPNDTLPQPGAGGIYWPAPGVPFGLSFVGTTWSEFNLIGFAYAYEQKTKTRLQKKAKVDAIPKTQLIDVVGH